MYITWLKVWGPLAQSVELRTWAQEIPGSSLVKVGGGLCTWPRHFIHIAHKLKLAMLALNSKAKYHTYTNKNVCARKGESKNNALKWDHQHLFYTHFVASLCSIVQLIDKWKRSFAIFTVADMLEWLRHLHLQGLSLRAGSSLLFFWSSVSYG